MWSPYLADIDAGVLLVIRPVAQRQAELLLAVLPAQLHFLQKRNMFPLRKTQPNLTVPCLVSASNEFKVIGSRETADLCSVLRRDLMQAL